MLFENKKVLVTGAGRSIGAAIAIGFAKAGADVMLTYRHNQSGIEDTVQQAVTYGHVVKTLQADFTTNAAVKACAEHVLSQFGVPDIVINNAAMNARSRFLDIDIDDFAQLLQVNTLAPFYLSQCLVKAMIADQIKGHIINISSIAGTTTLARGIAYATSKAALNKWTKNAALDLASHGIRVNAVAPGAIQAGMNATTAQENPEGWQTSLSRIPLGRAGRPQDIADMVLFLASDAADWVTGKVYEVDGGQVG